MSYLIGVDEAGYGPNLGPLVITASVWRVPEAMSPENLYRALDAHVAAPGDAARGRVVVGDSKRLYRAAGELHRLESPVLGAGLTVGLTCGTWRRLWSSLVPQAKTDLAREPWFQAYDRVLPLAAPWDDVFSSVATWHAAFEETDVALLALRAVAVFPLEWNRLLEQHGGKAEVLSRTTLQLVRDCLEQVCHDDGLRRVYCDKHGGRNRYSALLQSVFPEHLVEVWQEGREQSRYCWGPAERRVECRFVARGERCLASGLSSMVAKYLRETAMQAFNAFWQQHLPRLKPTAGYPVDARRFCREIAGIQRELGIDEERLWRRR